MNLGKLLAAGKSIISGQRKPAYREDKHVYLPKFVSPRNPFVSLTEAPPPEIAGTAKVRETIRDSLVTAKTQKLPVLSSPSKSFASWAVKLKPAVMFRGQPAPQPAKPAVQPELSLDSVKVVHNDLSDADVEVVPIKSRPAAKPVIPDLPPADKPWELMGERMMKVEVS
jgi:hypothetical protein